MIWDFIKNYFSKPSNNTLIDLLSGSNNTYAGVNITDESAMRCASVYGCVRVLSESIASLPLHLYRQDEKSRVRAVDHHLYDLLRFAPNDVMSAYEFWEYIAISCILRGNAYIRKTGNRFGRITSLDIIPTQAVEIKRKSDGKIEYHVKLSGADSLVLSSEDVLHFRGLSLDGLTGLGVIKYARESIALAMAAERHGATMFGNGGRPAGLLVNPQHMDPEDAKRFREKWDDAFRGANSNKTAILYGGLEWKQISLSNEDAQFLETRKYQRSEICGMFRVPPHMIGDLDRATFSNIEHQDIQFAKHALRPWLRRFESAIRKQLIRPDDRHGLYAEFMIDDILRGDFPTRMSGYATAIQNGIYSPNEVRAKENANPREGGDVYFTPSNMQVYGAEDQEDQS